MAGSIDEILEKLYGRLHDEPLQPGDPLYEPIYRLEPDQNEPIEPIDLLTRHIRWRKNESLQFFSGFRGAGKTTELYRLQDQLKSRGYFVVYADALDYINPAGRLDITDLLMTLAGAFSDALEQELGKDLKRESYWTRIRHYLGKTEVNLTELEGSSDGIGIKGALKESPTFRQDLQRKMAYHLGTLKQEVHKFFEDGVRAIREAKGDVQIVFIFDSLEQIRGSISNEAEVTHSVEVIFGQHLDKLRLPWIHAVFTVPPWLKFVLPNLSNLVFLPCVQQWQNNHERSPFESGHQALKRMLNRRLTEDGCKRLFAHPGQAERLIGMSGGHFRDVLRLLQETLLRAHTLPVSDGLIEKAIAAVRSSFLPIGVDDAKWLDAIARSRRPSHRSRDDVDRLTRFLDTHLVLYFSGEAEWYDIHPLIREEVEQIVRAESESAGAASSAPAGASGAGPSSSKISSALSPNPPLSEP